MVQRFLGPDRNLLAAPTTTLVADSTAPAVACAWEDPAIERTGSGALRLGGPYTGAADTRVEVEIVGGGGSARVCTAPVYAGAGNGTLTGLAATGDAVVEEVTATLQDLGTDTAAATLPLEGVVLRAATPGDAGNALHLVVDATGLAYTDTDRTVLADLAAGDDAWEGEGYDWGGRPLVAGALHPDTPRICFGVDEGHVYRPWREWRTDRWVYRVTPALAAPVPAGARVRTVTGGYTVTVTDGTTTETYSGVVTPWDLLRQIQAAGAGALLAVDGAAAADRTPGGLAGREWGLRTAPWASPVQGHGSQYATDLEALTVPAGAPTQAVRLECVSDAARGAEQWAVTGSVSGAMGRAITAAPFVHPALTCTVPARTPAAGTDPTFALAARVPAHRTTGEMPPVCPDLLTLGTAARDATVTLTYRARPVGGCPCEDTTYTGEVVPALLGLAALPAPAPELPQYQAQADAWIHDLTYTLGVGAVVSWRPVWATDLYAEWPANPDDDMAYLGASPCKDAWVAALCSSPAQAATLLAQLRSATAVASHSPDGVNTYWWAKIVGPDPADPLADLLRHPRAGEPGGQWCGLSWGSSGVYQLAESGTYTIALGPGGPDPAMPAWYAQFPSEQAATDFLAEHWAVSGLPADTGGEVGATLDLRTSGPPQAALDAIAHCLARLPEASGAPSLLAVWQDWWALLAADLPAVLDGTLDGWDPDFGDRYADAEAALDDALEEAVVAWADLGGTHWWEVDTTDEEGDRGDYLPAFTNAVYHAARRVGGAPVSTREFALVLRCECPGSLIEGDQVVLRITGVGDGGAYRVGDVLALSTYAAAPAYLYGGVTGDDTHTWGVRGSVSGALPDYAVVHGAEEAYDAAGLTFVIRRGGIPAAAGDRWTWSVEAGTLRWRRDGGAWSAALPLPAAPLALADGLALEAQGGPAPCWAAGDTWAWQVRQPYAPGHVATAHPPAWQWEGEGATLTATLATPAPVSAVAVVRYHLPAGATVTVGAYRDGDLLWSEVLTAPSPDPGLPPAPLVALRPAASEVDELRWTVADAPGGAIAGLWAGEPLALTVPADDCRIGYAWEVSRGEGLNPAARLLGTGLGAVLSWEAWLSEEDRGALVALLRAQHAAGDAPWVFVPHADLPAQSLLVTAGDGLELRERLGFEGANLTGPTRRRIAASLTLRGVRA